MSDDKGRSDEEKQALKDAEEKEKTMNESAATFDDTADTATNDRAKFINGDAGAEVHVAIPDKKKQKEFLGLSKEELMKYSNDPFWVRVRWILLILFWLAWFAMLAAAIIIIVVTPSCPYRADLKWWQSDVVYQVYPRSFKDTNDDGKGDLKGIQSKLDYIKEELGAKAIYMNPVYKSENKDFGYDITDYKAIDPAYGTMADFNSLLSSMHKEGMKLIMDFVPNHVSNKHPWFNASKLSKSEKDQYRDYFVWVDGTSNTPPNNWKSIYGGSAWTWEQERKQWYLHQFLPEQPDLNLHNPKVQEELENVLKFWLGKGVDGFRVDAAEHMFESNDTSKDEKKLPNPPSGTNSDSYEYYDHEYTTFQPETYKQIIKWKSLLNSYSEDDEDERFLVVEASGKPDQMMKFYEYEGDSAADMPFNMNLLKVDSKCGGKCVRDLVHDSITNLPDGKWANWVLGNHDTSRIATRKGTQYVRAMDMLVKLLPGTVFTYYGDEIGMVDGDISAADIKDHVKGGKGRDPERTPMQWNGSPYAGFTNSSSGPWLPVNANFQDKNVQAQMAHGAGVSDVDVYLELAKLREKPSFQWGKYKEAITDDSLFSFVRSADGFKGYLVAINFGPSKTTVDFHSVRKDLIPAEATIYTSTQNFDDYNRHEDFKNKKTVKLDHVRLHPGEGIVFEWPADALEE